MKNEQKEMELAGNLQQELREIQKLETLTDGIETYGSISVGCSQFLTIICC